MDDCSLKKDSKWAEYPPFWTYYNVLDVLEFWRLFRVQEAVGSNPATRTTRLPVFVENAGSFFLFSIVFALKCYRFRDAEILLPLQLPLTGFFLVLGYAAAKHEGERPHALASTGPFL